MSAVPTTERIIVEACVGSLEDALSAARRGADRIEFCSSLEMGGLTPKLDEIRRLKERLSIPMVAMIRPRGGDFCYSETQWSAMMEAAAEALDAGADGIVVGVLTPEGIVDEPKIRELIAVVKCRPGKQVIFHRALDESNDLWTAWSTLKSLGVDRVLTSGGAATATLGIEMLSKLEADSRQNGGRSAVLAAGGIRSANVIDVLRRTGVQQIHSACTQGSGPTELDEGEFTALIRAVRGFESRQIAGDGNRKNEGSS
jgi:copper homeostasis protein